MKKVYSIFGIIAPLSYIMAVIIGGFLLEGYSHMYNSISELTASNVPKIPIIFTLFFIYNISLILFGIKLYVNLKTISGSKISLASIMLIIVGLLGIAMLYYVQDPRDIQITLNGKIHIILAAISSVLTMISIILSGLTFKNNPNMKKFAAYSFISFWIVFVAGGIAGISVANNYSFGGLFERLTIGAFMQWIFVIAVKLKC